MSTSAQEDLLCYMQNFSEHRHCAGWLSGIEFRLWRLATTGDPYSTEMSKIEAKHTAAMLMEMAEAAGGWWRWNNEFSSREFVSLDTWKKIYTRRKWF